MPYLVRMALAKLPWLMWQGKPVVINSPAAAHELGIALVFRHFSLFEPLSVWENIEIVRCLLQSPKLLIMDEPTSVLTPQEVYELFVTLKRLAKEGMATFNGYLAPLIALALVDFASWQPGRLLFGAYLFGGISIIQLHAQAIGFNVPSQLMSMLPYAATILVLVLISRDRGRIRRNALNEPVGSKKYRRI